MFGFGSGTLNATPTVGSPASFGTLQDVSVDIAFTTKELYGSKQFPVAIARGTGKISGKAKFANINGALLNDLFFKNTASVVGSTTTISLTSQALGTTPIFQLVLQQVTNGKTFTLTLNKCTSSKLSLATKMEDWNIQEFDFQAYADDSDAIGTLVITE